jgi:hypothetical protein
MNTPSQVVGPEQSLLLWCWVRHVAAEPPAPLLTESEHVSGRVLAVQLQAIGPKRNSALLGLASASSPTEQSRSDCPFTRSGSRAGMTP